MLLGMNILKHTSIDFRTKEITFSLGDGPTSVYKHKPKGLRITIQDSKISDSVDASHCTTSSSVAPGATDSCTVSESAASVCSPLT